MKYVDHTRTVLTGERRMELCLNTQRVETTIRSYPFRHMSCRHVRPGNPGGRTVERERPSECIARGVGGIAGRVF